jgi:hypothetical protein
MEWMKMGNISVDGMVGVIVVLVVGVSLLGIVISSVATAALSLTGASLTMVNLIPLFFVIGLTLYVIYWAIGKKHG